MSRRCALAVGAAAFTVAVVGAPPGAGAQLLPTTTEAPTTTVAETTVPPETTAPPTTEPPPTTAPPTTAPPATRAPSTTAAPTTEAPTTTTTAPPSAPPTIATTTVPVDGRTRITQDTPDLGGVLTLWGVGIAGTIATLLWSWRQNRTEADDQEPSRTD